MRGGTSRTHNWWAADLFDSGSPLPPEEKSPARPQKPAGIFTRSLQGLRPYITPPTWSRCEESNGITFHPELITYAPYDQYLHLLHLLSKQKKKCGSATRSLSISSLGRPLYHASTADSCRTTWWLKTAAKATILARLALRHCFVSANGHELGCTSPGHSWFFFQRHSFLENTSKVTFLHGTLALLPIPSYPEKLHQLHILHQHLVDHPSSFRFQMS